MDKILEFLPIIIVVAIIGAFTIAFILAYLALRKHKDPHDDRERNMTDREIVVRLLRYAKPYWKNFVGVFFIMLFSIVYDLLSPALIGDIQSLIKNDFQLKDLFVRVAVYAGILGWYPVLRPCLEGLPRPIRWAVKWLIFNGTAVAVYALLLALMGMSALDLGAGWELILVLALANVVFYLYDRVLNLLTARGLGPLRRLLG